jgi:hypothetical protein
MGINNACVFPNVGKVVLGIRLKLNALSVIIKINGSSPNNKSQMILKRHDIRKKIGSRKIKKIA